MSPVGVQWEYSGSLLCWESVGSPMGVHWESSVSPLGIHWSPLLVCWESTGSPLGVRWESAEKVGRGLVGVQ
jgi:hypothetical protein